MELQLDKAAGIDLVHVQLMFAAMTNAILIKGGKIVPYSVSLPQRSPNLPDVPAFADLGCPQMRRGWGLWVAPDVPAAAQGRLRGAAIGAADGAKAAAGPLAKPGSSDEDASNPHAVTGLEETIPWASTQQRSDASTTRR